jgi:hypothetical protein
LAGRLSNFAYLLLRIIFYWLNIFLHGMCGELLSSLVSLAVEADASCIFPGVALGKDKRALGSRQVPALMLLPLHTT